MALILALLVLPRHHAEPDNQTRPTFFENIQGHTALTAGELLISQGLAMGGGIALSGVLYNRIGPRILVATGLALLVVGTYRLTQLQVNTTGLSLQIWLALRGLGLGLTLPSLQTVAVSKRQLWLNQQLGRRGTSCVIWSDGCLG